MKRYDPVKECLQEARRAPGPSVRSQATKIHQSSQGDVPNEYTLRSSHHRASRQQYPDTESRGCISTSTSQNRQKHRSASTSPLPYRKGLSRTTFDDRLAAANSILLPPIQTSAMQIDSSFQHPCYTHPSASSLSRPFVTSRCGPSHLYRLDGRPLDQKILRPSISNEGMRGRYLSRDICDRTEIQSTRSSPSASTVHSFSPGDFGASEEEFSDVSSSGSSVNQPTSIVTNRLMHANSERRSAPLSLQNPATSPSASESSATSQSYSWLRHPVLGTRVSNFSLPSTPAMMHRTGDGYTVNHAVASVGSNSYSRHGKEDPADRFLVETVIDGIRNWQCIWNKGIDERGRGIACGHKASRSNARQHVKSRHLKLRPYVCPECGRTWRDQGARYNHRVREHGYVPKKPKRWPESDPEVPQNGTARPWNVAFVMDPNSPCRQGESDVAVTAQQL